MTPVLYGHDEKEFRTNGIGRLSDCLSCRVTEERNGVYELEMEYPAGGIHFGELKHSRLVCAAHDSSGKPQPFRIYQVTEPISGICTVRAEHVSYRLKDIPVLPFEASTAAEALDGVRRFSATDNPFTFWTDVATDSSYSQKVPRSARESLGGVEGSILDCFGGEYEWDGYAVRLHAERGRDRGVALRYGVNITDVTEEVDTTDSITGVLPYYQDDSTTVTGSISYVRGHESFPFERVLAVDVSGEFGSRDDGSIEGETTNAPTADEVTEAGRRNLLERSYPAIPSDSITVSFVDLGQTEEYGGCTPPADIRLCDTVTVSYEKLGVSAKTKVVKTVYDVLHDRYESIEVGTIRKTATAAIADTMKAVDDLAADAERTKSRYRTWVRRLEDRVSIGAEELEEARGEITVLAGEIDQKVSKGSIIAEINLTPESATIDASRINLFGYVTAYDLETGGRTVVNGDNITTGTVRAERLELGSYAKTADVNASISASEAGILQRTVSKDGIISAINQSAEEVRIQAERISLEGTVTANSYFKVLSDGSVEAVNAAVTGEIKATSLKLKEPTYGNEYTVAYIFTGGTRDALRVGQDTSSYIEFPMSASDPLNIISGTRYGVAIGLNGSGIYNRFTIVNGTEALFTVSGDGSGALAKGDLEVSGRVSASHITISGGSNILRPSSGSAAATLFLVSNPDGEAPSTTDANTYRIRSDGDAYFANLYSNGDRVLTASTGAAAAHCHSRLYAGADSSNAGVVVTSGAEAFRPTVNASMSLGWSSHKWKDVQAVDGSFSGAVTAGTVTISGGNSLLSGGRIYFGSIPSGDPANTDCRITSTGYGYFNGLRVGGNAVATQDWVEGKGYLSNSIATGSSSSNSASVLASTQWVVNKGYLTSHQSLSGYLKSPISTDVKMTNGTLYFNNGTTNKYFITSQGAAELLSMKAGSGTFSGRVNLADGSTYYISNTGTGHFYGLASAYAASSGGTVSDAANVFITSSGAFRKSTASSRRYKHDVTGEIKDALAPERLLGLPVKQFKYNTDYLTNPADSRYDTDVVGFMAEDVDEAYPVACEYDEGGRPENWNFRYLVPPMLSLIQKAHREIEGLRAQVGRLEERVRALEAAAPCT